MEKIPHEKLVFHGSPTKFDSDHAVPKQNKRFKTVGGEQVTIFNEESFHATPYKWIALAYTYKSVPHEINGKTAHYNMGVSLYDHNGIVYIHGLNNLEESLEKLYENGGYLYHFDKDKFIYKEGLGDLEMIIQKPTKPITVEYISDPVAEMKKLGVTFRFIDLALPENESFRNYY
jgi:hypothetical protein